MLEVAKSGDSWFQIVFLFCVRFSQYIFGIFWNDTFEWFPMICFSWGVLNPWSFMGPLESRRLRFRHTLWLWHSHGKWPIEIEVYRFLKMVIFHGYVSHNQMVSQTYSWYFDIFHHISTGWGPQELSCLISGLTWLNGLTIVYGCLW